MLHPKLLVETKARIDLKPDSRGETEDDDGSYSCRIGEHGGS